MDKLSFIQCGDTVEYLHENVRSSGEVHGWKLDTHGTREHRAIVGNESYEREIPLKCIIARERKKGAGSGIIEF